MHSMINVYKDKFHLYSDTLVVDKMSFILNCGLSDCIISLYKRYVGSIVT